MMQIQPTQLVESRNPQSLSPAWRFFLRFLVVILIPVFLLNIWIIIPFNEDRNFFLGDLPFIFGPVVYWLLYYYGWYTGWRKAILIAIAVFSLIPLAVIAYLLCQFVSIFGPGILLPIGD
jgi:hypothetical protein